MVLITGAAGGMGRLLALRMLALGAGVIAWDIDRTGLTRLSEAAGESDRNLTTIVCDLTDPGDIESCARTTLELAGSIDILVNNAGIVSGAGIMDITDDQIERTFAVNTLAPMRVTRAFLPSMIERGSGHIVTLASAGGFVAAPRLSDYCASKFAVIGFDEALRLEMKEKGHRIRTTLVAPFFVDTGMFAGVKTRFSLLLPIMKPEYVVEKMIRAIYRRKNRLILPRFVYMIFPIRLLPVSWFDALISFFGIRDSMNAFRGRD
jgi:short-subunit dehydrogenase